MSVGRVRNTPIPASLLSQQETCQKNNGNMLCSLKHETQHVRKSFVRTRCRLQIGTCRLQHAEHLIES